MSIVRDLAITIPAMEERSLITCSTGGQVFSGNTGNNSPSSAALLGINGNIIDRFAEPLGIGYKVAMPSAMLRSTRGSTESNRQLTLGVGLQHGDSSGGGDMADYSTGSRKDDVVFFGTARTTDMKSWDAGYSTGLITGIASAPTSYDLRAAKRYLRTVVTASKNKVTTESSGDEGARLSATLTFIGVDDYPRPSVNGPLSTSTST